MNGVARFDAARFARDVSEGLGGVSYRVYSATRPWITINTISRAANRRPLSVANFLALCASMNLDPLSYFSIENQPVPAAVSRETRRRESVGSILARLQGSRA